MERYVILLPGHQSVLSRPLGLLVMNPVVHYLFGRARGVVLEKDVETGSALELQRRSGSQHSF